MLQSRQAGSMPDSIPSKHASMKSISARRGHRAIDVPVCERVEDHECGIGGAGKVGLAGM